MASTHFTCVVVVGSTLQELACVDLSLDIAEAVLEVIRRRLEAAANRAKEEATTRLLLELEEEERAKKAAQKVR